MSVEISETEGGDGTEIKTCSGFRSNCSICDVRKPFMSTERLVSGVTHTLRSCGQYFSTKTWRSVLISYSWSAAAFKRCCICVWRVSTVSITSVLKPITDYLQCFTFFELLIAYFISLISNSLIKKSYNSFCFGAEIDTENHEIWQGLVHTTETCWNHFWW